MPHFYDLSVAKANEVLKTRETGLSHKEISARQKKYGRNKLLVKKSTSWVIIFMRQFISALMAILVFALVVSLAFGDYIDGIMIAAAIFINVVVGFAQEYKASNALEKLRSFIVPITRVRRDGRDQEIPSSELVPGDVIVLSPGDRVPADARLFHVDALEADEALLTGESMQVSKHTDRLRKDTVLAERYNMVFSGTVITSGRGEAIVIATGLETQIGKIAKLVSETEDTQSPLQIQLAHLGRFLAILYSVLAVIIFGLGLLLGKSLFEMFILSVALAVAAVPEGLLVAVTVVLAIGMQRMLRRKVLVRRLVATETLGSVSIICTDKTGTITEAKMQVSTIRTADGEQSVSTASSKEGFASVQRTVLIGALCNDASVTNPNIVSPDRYVGSPTDVAILMIGEVMGQKNDFDAYTRVATIPFDSEYKYMMTLNDGPLGREIYAKGAAEIILAKSSKVLVGNDEKSLSDKRRQELVREADIMTQQGLRVLGFAYKNVQSSKFLLAHDDLNDVVFAGFMGLRDPVRASAKETISKA
ncbi:MAG: HAD-IC family P-type ATPase, partial [bacterium]|nr:HAD-IC family P-type ATPase [bacterium]